MHRRRYLDKAAPADNRTITIGQIPRGYVDSHGDMVVRTPKGVKTTLQEAYEKYNQTPVAVENIPGLTDYLITQDNNDIQEAAHMRKIAGDRFVHQLGEERDKALMAIAAGAFGGGALASGLALAPVATLGSIGGGILGEKAWDKIYGDTWGQDVERWTNGYIPAVVGEYLNPGSLIGGGLGSQVGKVPSLAYKGFLRMPQTKRAVEVAMRTSKSSNPIQPMIDSIRVLRNTKEGRTQLKDVAKYIALGKRQTNRPYRSLAGYNNPYEPVEYGGILYPDENNYLRPAKDLIDAYLYGDVIDPRFLKLIDKGKNFGIHTDYINKYYKGKAKNIPVYEGGLGDDGLGEFGDPLSAISPVNNIDYKTAVIKGAHGEIRSLVPEHPINTAGHLIAQDAQGNRISQDIWKFNPDEYTNKWLGDSNYKIGIKDIVKDPGIIKDYVRYHLAEVPKYGLKIVNDIGTPVVIRSKPFKYDIPNKLSPVDAQAALDELRSYLLPKLRISVKD